MKGYEIIETRELTSAMEDYLEMICRFARDSEAVRVNELAGRLHVRPSSASKMMSNLKEIGCVRFEKYGTIVPTEKGLALGGYLLRRHEALHRFLCLLNHTDDELEQVEKIEHFLTPETIANLERLTERLLGGAPEESNST